MKKLILLALLLPSLVFGQTSSGDYRGKLSLIKNKGYFTRLRNKEDHLIKLRSFKRYGRTYYKVTHKKFAFVIKPTKNPRIFASKAIGNILIYTSYNKNECFVKKILSSFEILNKNSIYYGYTAKGVCTFGQDFNFTFGGTLKKDTFDFL